MRRRARQLVVDLTPLLDVILILLFLILVSSQTAAARRDEARDLEQAAQERRAAEAQLSMESQLASEALRAVQAERDGERLQRQLDEAKARYEALLKDGQLSEEARQRFAVMRENSDIIDLRVPPGYPERPLELRINDRPILHKPAAASLESWLTAHIEPLQKHILILTLHYDNEGILWRDYQQLNRLLLELRARSGHSILYNEQHIGGASP